MTAHLSRLRELDALPLRTLVLVSSPEPRYFLRVPGGWHAADARGDTALQDELVRELPGWPETIPSADLRRPVVAVDRIPEPVLTLRELVA